MRLTTSLLALAALFCLLPASAQYARFAKPTDTIGVNGNTALIGQATYEARILLTDKPNGYVFFESTGNSEFKYLGIGQLLLWGNAYGYDNLGYVEFSLPIRLKQWHHIAYVYGYSGRTQLYLDGQLIADRASYNNNIYDGYGRFQVGAFDKSNPAFIGYMDYVRISDIPRYNGNFKPPIGDLPADEHTQLLYNFNEPVGSTTVTDEGILANDGVFGTGFTGATSPEIVATVPEVGSVSGTVQLKYSLDPEQYLTFEFRKSGSDPFQRKLVLVPTGADTGSFYLSGIPAGTYNIAVRGSGYIRKVVPNVVVSGGANTLPLVELIPADINNDNNVDIFDLAVLAEYFNTFGDL